MCFAPQQCALFRHLNFQKWSEPGVFCTFVHFVFEMCFAPRRCALFQHLNFQKCSEAELFFFGILSWKCASRHNGVHFFDISLPKVVRSCGVLYILTSKCASRHNCVHFFDSATSKSAPELRWFVHFDFQMCFAPQRRAIFHLSSGQLAPHPPL